MLDGCTPWPEGAARWYREHGLWTGECLWDLLEASAARWPDGVAVVDGDERVTYRELRDRAARVAGGLAALGLRPLDRVVFQLANGAPFVEAFFALQRLGVIPVLAFPSHRHAEVAALARHAEAVALLVPDLVKGFDHRALAERVRGEVPSVRLVVVDGEALPGQASLEWLARGNRAPDFRPEPGEVALMLVSGGASAPPKLVPRTHDDYALAARLAARVAGVDEGSVLLLSLSLAHNYNLGSPGLLGAIQAGARVVLAPRPDAETVLGLVEREEATHLSATVPLVVQWLASDAVDRRDLGKLQVVQNAGSRLAPGLRRQLRERLRCTPQEVYGTAEGLLNMTRLDDPDDLLLESSGAPVSPLDDLRVLGDGDLEVPDGEPGELVARGPYTICGYYRNPEANAAAFTRDGFYRMGDLVRKRGRYVWVEGRRKDVVNRGGEKVGVEELEDLLLRCPKVRAVAVVPVADATFGERACAVVIPDDAEDPPTLADLTAFLQASGIARFKWPERLVIVDAFPVSPAGKILRRELRDAAEEELRQAAG